MRQKFGAMRQIDAFFSERTTFRMIYLAHLYVLLLIGWCFWLANHSGGHIWAELRLEKHAALWLVCKFLYSLTQDLPVITLWNVAHLTSRVHEIKILRDQSWPQHVPSWILADFLPDNYVFRVKNQISHIFQCPGGVAVLTVSITSQISSKEFHYKCEPKDFFWVKICFLFGKKDLCEEFEQSPGEKGLPWPQ